MSRTLRSRTARSSLILLHENLGDLRTYAENFDPAQIDRLTKAAELTSTTIKKLLAWLEPETKNDARPMSADDCKLIDIPALCAFLDDVSAGRICPECSGRRTDRAA
jgi:hypothetical protein